MPGTKSAFAAAIGRRALDAWIRLRYIAKARAVMRPPPRESSVGAKRERQEGAEGGVSAWLLACQTVSLPAIPPCLLLRPEDDGGEGRRVARVQAVWKPALRCGQLRDT